MRKRHVLRFGADSKRKAVSGILIALVLTIAFILQLLSPTPVHAAGDPSNGAVCIGLAYHDGQSHPDGLEFSPGGDGSAHLLGNLLVNIGPNNYPSKNVSNLKVTISAPQKYVREIDPHDSTALNGIALSHASADATGTTTGMTTLTFTWASFPSSSSLVSIPFDFYMTGGGAIPNGTAIPFTATVSSDDHPTPVVAAQTLRFRVAYATTLGLRIPGTPATGDSLVLVTGSPTQDAAGKYYVPDDAAEPVTLQPVVMLSNSEGSRAALSGTVTVTLPTYTAEGGTTRTARFDPASNPGWSLSAGRKTISRTFTGSTNLGITRAINASSFSLTFPGLILSSIHGSDSSKDALGVQASVSYAPKNPAAGEQPVTASTTKTIVATSSQGFREGIDKVVTANNFGTYNINDTPQARAQSTSWTLTFTNRTGRSVSGVSVTDYLAASNDLLKITGVTDGNLYVPTTAGGIVDFNTPSSFKTVGSSAVKEIRAYTSRPGDAADGTYDTCAPTQSSSGFSCSLGSSKTYVRVAVVLQDGYQVPAGSILRFRTITAFRDPSKPAYRENSSTNNFLINYARASMELATATRTTGITVGDVMAQLHVLQYKQWFRLIADRSTQYNQRMAVKGNTYTHYVRIMANVDASSIRSPRLVMLLPSGFNPVDGGSYQISTADNTDSGKNNSWDSSWAPLVTPSACTTTKNYRSTGRTAITCPLSTTALEQMAAKAQSISDTSNPFYIVTVTGTFASGPDTRPLPGSFTAFDDYATADNAPVQTESDYTVADGLKIGPNARIVHSSTTLGVLESSLEQLVQYKYAAPIESGSSTFDATDDQDLRTDLTLRPGQAYRYSVRIINTYESTAFPNVTVMDALPDVGDADPATGKARGSQMAATLTGPAIVSDESFNADAPSATQATVAYSVDPKARTETMNSALGLQWLPASSFGSGKAHQWSEVTAIRVVLPSLAAQHVVDISLPAKAPDAQSSLTASSGPLSASTGFVANSSSPSASDGGESRRVTAVNIAARKLSTDVTPAVTNTSLATIPWAAFQVKKTSSAGGSGLAGASLRLTQVPSSGTTAGRSVSATTDSTGAASFANLAVGTYRLEETKTPSQHYLSMSPVTVTVTKGENGLAHVSFACQAPTGQGTSESASPKNCTGAGTSSDPLVLVDRFDGETALPSTGGRGILAAVCVILLLILAGTGLAVTLEQ